MNCPSCGKTVADAAWICGFCDHILDASVLGDVYDDSDETKDARAPSGHEERTSLIAWKPKTNPRDDEVPDALILGDVGVEEDDFQLVHGAAKRGDGRTATFLFYASGATSRIVHPEAIPRITGGDQTIPRTPYEDFILASIDGVRSVRDIHRSSGLAPQEVVVTLLTLLDKGAIRIDGVAAERAERPTRMRDLDLESEKTEAIQRPASGPQPGDGDDLPSVTDFDEIMSDGPDAFDDVWAESDEYDEITNGALPTSDRKSGEARGTAKRAASGERLEVFARAGPQDRRAKRAASDASGEGREGSARAGPQDRRAKRAASDASGEGRGSARAGPQDPAERKRSVRNQRSDTKPPVRAVAQLSELPTAEDPPLEDPPTLSVLDQPTVNLDEPTSSPVRPEAPPPPLLLDPAFLVEVPPSDRARRPSISDLHLDLDNPPMVAPVPEPRRESSGRRKAKEKQRAVLEKAVKRGPVEERVHSRKPPPLPQPPQPVQEQSVPSRRAKAEPVDSAMMLKAQKLFDQALKDKSEGNLVSARMNMKLAMTFDSTNELYAQSFDELSKNPDAQIKTTGPTAKSRAREFYDAATEAETSGDIDRAVGLLEQAIASSKQAPFLNRLGVLLAMKKREFGRAQQLVEQAIQLAPGNGAYEKNLQKIVSMAATSDMRKHDEEKDAKKGLLGGLLGRRK